ncbi:MAG: hypothetical protein E7356_01605 [Clostridiales bacterium]|nr:hypothetical protein [Clostridiales bacterium]
MAEIKELEMIHIPEGAERSGGQSCNYWFFGYLPQGLLDFIDSHRNFVDVRYDPLTGHEVQCPHNKASIWTSIDDAIYNQPRGSLKSRKLPAVSMTFKSCFNDHSAQAEHIGCLVAMALDQPTSYNFIVKFDPDKHRRITDNYPTPSKIKNVRPYGIVSVDFLQLKKGQQHKSTSSYHDKDGKYHEIESISDYTGDELISFEQIFKENPTIAISKMSGDENLMENWIYGVDEYVKKELKGCPREFINKEITKIHSRMARSFLLRELLGDSDFASYNSGLVFNRATKRLRYAPEHDFGAAFNGLIQNKLKKIDPYFGFTKEKYDALPETMKQTLAMSTARKSRPIPDIAKDWASASGEENFHYVLNNFPNASREFFENLDTAVMKGELENIIDTVGKMTCNGKPLLTKKECEMFKEYILCRAAHLTEKYIEHLKSNNMPIFTPHNADPNSFTFE